MTMALIHRSLALPKKYECIHFDALRLSSEIRGRLSSLITLRKLNTTSGNARFSTK